MLNQYEITLANEKFKAVGQLRDLLASLESIKYSSFGSFQSAILFKRTFSGTFDLLVEDESQLYEVAEKHCVIDRKKALMHFYDTNEQSGFKIRVYDTASKFVDVRNYILDNTNLETCFIISPDGIVDKLEIEIPKRGVSLVQQLSELDADEIKRVHAIEKIVWSLSNIGVATLLRDLRFMPQNLVDIAADQIEEMMVEHANKSVSALRIHGGEKFKTLTSSELKKFGKPFAALLKA